MDSVTAPAGFSAEELVARCMGDRDFALMLMDVFIERLPGKLKGIEDAIAARESSSVAALAHSLKGEAANLSLAPLHAAADKLEKNAVRENLDAIPACLASLAAIASQTLKDAARISEMIGPR